jgi:hypothetical protein
MMNRYNLTFVWGSLKIVLDGLAAFGVAVSAFRTGRLIGGQDRADRGASLLVKSSRPAPVSVVGSGSSAP